jgi:hypothetical protein
VNPFDSFDAIEQRLVGRGILNYQLGLAVNGQDQRVPGLSEAAEQIEGIALELTERPNVVGQVEHRVLIKFALNLMIVRANQELEKFRRGRAAATPTG